MRGGKPGRTVGAKSRWECVGCGQTDDVRFVVRYELLIVTEIQILILMRFYPGGLEAEAGTSAVGWVGGCVAHDRLSS